MSLLLTGLLTWLVLVDMQCKTQLTRRARSQDCEPLWLTAPNGTRFKFLGVREVAKGTLAAEAALAPPDDVGEMFSELRLLEESLTLRQHCRASISECKPAVQSGMSLTNVGNCTQKCTVHSTA